MALWLRDDRGDAAREAGLTMIFTLFFPLAASASTVVMVEYLHGVWGGANEVHMTTQHHQYGAAVPCESRRSLPENSGYDKLLSHVAVPAQRWAVWSHGGKWGCVQRTLFARWGTHIWYGGGEGST